MEQVNVFSSENNAVGAHARLLVCVENSADNPKKESHELDNHYYFVSCFQHVHVHVLPRRAGDFSRNDDVYKEVSTALCFLFRVDFAVKKSR